MSNKNNNNNENIEQQTQNKSWWKTLLGFNPTYNSNKIQEMKKQKFPQSIIGIILIVIYVLLYILLILLTPFFGNSDLVFINKKYDKLIAILLVISILIIILWHFD